ATWQLAPILQAIAKIIEVSTIKDKVQNVFSLNWEDIIEDDGQGLKNYKPRIIEKNLAVGKTNGTTITLREIQRSSNFDAEALANSLSRFFIIEENIKITVQRNNEAVITLTNERRYATLNKEFTWSVPEDLPTENDYEHRRKVVGKIYTTETPISPSTGLRGITLFSRKKLVNMPEYFSDSTSSHVYSYLSGWLEVDFIDDLDQDVIETNRQSLNWDHPEIEGLRNYLRSLIRAVEKEWRAKRKAAQDVKLSARTSIDVSAWRESLPKEIEQTFGAVLDTLRKESELPEKDDAAIRGIEQLYRLVPPYTYYQYRHLNSGLSEVVFDYYKNEDYYTAVFEGAKRYVAAVKLKSSSTLTDRALLENVFRMNKNDKNPKLSVIEGYLRPNGTEFEARTLTGISEGHGLLAAAMWQAFRCPVAHEVSHDLRASELFTENDCLDALSLLSHLFRRLETATVVSPS
ncbi:MAG: TIGR02391 family protein, partial [Raoultibacter sp.]